MKHMLFCSLFLIAVLCTVYSTDTFRHKSRLSLVAAATIRNGITRKTEVFALLGPPRDIVTQVPIRQLPGTPPLDAKNLASEVWHYCGDAPEKAIAGATQAAYFVTVFFDEGGIVLDCETMTGR